MKLANVLVALLGFGMMFEGLGAIFAGPTVTQQIYGATLFGSGAIVVAIAALIMAVAFPERR